MNNIYISNLSSAMQKPELLADCMVFATKSKEFNTFELLVGRTGDWTLVCKGARTSRSVSVTFVDGKTIFS